MSDQQRRDDIIAQACATLERTKNIAERRDELLLPSPRDPGAEWRQRATEHTAECAQAKAERQLEQRLERMLELRLEQELAASAQAFAEMRDFVLEAVEKVVAQMRSERDERDDSRAAELNAEFARIWKSLTAAHTALVAIQEERRAETVASERPATAKLN
jgi:hypothetical protein